MRVRYLFRYEGKTLKIRVFRAINLLGPVLCTNLFFRNPIELYLGLEEGLGAADSDLVHVDLGEGGELAQPRVQLQLTSPQLHEYLKELPVISTLYFL